MTPADAADHAHNDRVRRERVAFAEAAAQRILTGANARRPHSPPIDEPDRLTDDELDRDFELEARARNEVWHG